MSTRTIAPLGTVLVFALGLSACSGEPEATPAPAPSAPTAAPAAAEPPPEAPPAGPEPTPSEGSDGAGLELDVGAEALPAGAINPARFSVPALGDAALVWYLNNQPAPGGGAAQALEAHAGPQVLEVRSTATGKALSTAVRTVAPGEKVQVTVAGSTIACQGCTVL